LKLVAGVRVKSAVCSMEAIVIQPPSTPGLLTCGAEAALAATDAERAAVQLTAPEPGNALVGKRYVDAVSGLELLCTKSGNCAMSFDARPLTLREAKPLPSSD
jgi:hypothetical protein